MNEAQQFFYKNLPKLTKNDIIEFLLFFREELDTHNLRIEKPTGTFIYCDKIPEVLITKLNNYIMKKIK